MKKIAYLRDPVPDPGAALEVAAGIFWLRLPMPYALDHVNLWLLADGDSWTVIDCGPANPTCRRCWEEISDRYLGGRPLNRVICTHNHPDHLGLAGWLVRRGNGRLCLTRGEYENFQELLEDVASGDFTAARDFYRAAGLNSDRLDHYETELRGYLSLVEPLPAAYQPLENGAEITIGRHIWQVVIGGGHSSEHLCLHCPELEIFIAGDQLLPEISSNVSVWPRQPEANPLREWLDACRRLQTILNDRTLVLPAHGRPFRGARRRLETLLAESRERLKRLLAEADQPRRLVDLFPALFAAEIADDNLLMACGEARAGCNFLLAAGLLNVREDEQGVLWYRAQPDSITKLDVNTLPPGLPVCSNNLTT
jgi:glyoxylase-like metal-dependent hydrolase (beta-lactamase superfamily II)